jgi:SagB-type dehydrogenase family enzyme
MDDASAFDDFWTASELSALNRPAFFERMASFDPTPVGVDPWSRPAPGVPAERQDGPLSALLARRHSIRRFAPDALTRPDLGRLLSVLAEQPRTDGHRGHPAAGGLHAVRAIALVFTAERESGRLLQHDPRGHTLTDIGSCPGWPELVDDLAGHDAETAPAAVIGLFADTGRVLSKYGERGGRFVLLEAGAALQNLTLAAAELGLVGYPIGGSADARMLALAGLTAHRARYLVGYAVGRPV